MFQYTEKKTQLTVNRAVKGVKFGFDTDWCWDKANVSLYVNLCYVNHHYVRYLIGICQFLIEPVL